MDSSQMKETLQEILEYPHNKLQKDLASVMNSLEPHQFDEIVNTLLDQITANEVREFGLAHFNELDRYPNPHDGLLEREEISEAIALSRSARDKAILLWIWLSFDEIRQSSDDFEGAEKIFDVVLTLKDFERMKV